MPFHFYLSYAPADYSEDLRGFFEDLNCAIRAGLLLSEEEPVGFFNPRGIAPGSEWGTDVAEALRTSQTMVALTSPEYFRSEQCGKERQIFEMRRSFGPGMGSAESSAGVALAIWIPCDSKALPAVSEGGDGLGDLNGAYRKYGLLLTRKLFQDEYVNTLVSLAKHVIQLAQVASQPPLSVLPPFQQADNAFPSSCASSVSFTDQADKKSRAIVVERHQQVREMLVEYLRVSNFDVDGYEEAGQVPPQMLESESQTKPADLFVVDLEFETSERQGLSLIGKINAIKTRPGVLAMSASLSSQNLIEAMRMGAEDVVPKPFDVSKIVERMKKLASIGRNRRLHPPGQSQSPLDSRDPTRQKRPVFLSYSSADNDDKRVAIFLKSNIEARGIGVWYSEEILTPNHPEAVKHAFEAIGQAQVFLPLITNKYPSSTPCLAELLRFYTHQITDRSRVMMPVLHGLPAEIKNFEWIRPFIGDHREITENRFLDDLIALLGRIQKAVNGNGQP